jgi:hypothetical protein
MGRAGEGKCEVGTRQHTTEEEPNQTEGIVVPLELDGLRILRQEVQADGKLRVEVIATNKGERCPHCGTICVNVGTTPRCVCLADDHGLPTWNREIACALSPLRERAVST